MLKELTDYNSRASVTYEDFSPTRIRMLADLMAQKIHPLDTPVLEEYARHAAIRFKNYPYDYPYIVKMVENQRKELEKNVESSLRELDGLHEIFARAAVHPRTPMATCWRAAPPSVPIKPKVRSATTSCS